MILEIKVFRNLLRLYMADRTGFGSFDAEFRFVEPFTVATQAERPPLLHFNQRLSAP
jgi:hypothetical protein